MDVLREMFHDRPERDLARALEEASNDLERAIALVLERPAPPKPRRLANLTKLAVGAADFYEAPPLTPATASANMFGNMTLGEERAMALPQENGRRPSSPAPPAAAAAPVDPEAETIANMLAIFPDACPDFVKKLYKEHHVLQGANIVEFLANKFADEGYEKKQRIGTKRKRSDSEGDGENDIRKEATYNDENRPGVTPEYRALAKQLFAQEFPMMPANFIDKVLKENNSFISTTYPKLVAAEKLYKSNPKEASYKPLVKGRVIKASNEDMASRRGQSFSKIMEELELARKKARELEMAKQLEADAQLAAQLDEKEHEAADMILECKCCYADTPFDQMTHCGEGEHFFCLDCARQNAEHEIGAGKHKLVCMDESGCKAEFPRREVLRFIKKQQTLDLLSKLETEAAVRMAGIEDLVQCPFCDNAAICNSIEVDREFRCDNQECGIISCRLCQRKSHTPKTCEEAAKDDKISTRHILEEAMSAAIMRKCKKCGTPSIKEYGCNKMMCTKCSTMSCYVCNNIITGYDHFDDKTRGGQNGNCPLFDNHEKRHEEEAKAAAEAVKAKIRVENPEITDEDLEIQLSESAKKQEEERLQRAAPAGGAAARPAQPLYRPPHLNVAYNPAVVPPLPVLRGQQIPPPPPRIAPPYFGAPNPAVPVRRELAGPNGPVNFAAQDYQPNMYFVANNGPAVQLGIPQQPPPPPPAQRSRRVVEAIAMAQARDAQLRAQVQARAHQQAHQQALAAAYKPAPPNPRKAQHQQQQQQPPMYQNPQPRNMMGQFQANPNANPNAQPYNPGHYGPPVGHVRRAAAQNMYAPPGQPAAQHGRRGAGGR